MSRRKRETPDQNEKLMNHFRSPRNVGELPDPQAVVTVSNPVCGDTMRLFLRVEDGVIREARFKTFGCSAAIAASSALTELVRGRSLDEAERLEAAQIDRELGGLPPHKLHATALVTEAIREAVAAARRS